MSMTYFTLSPSVSNAYIEQLNAGWEIETWTRDFNLTEGSRQSQKNPSILLTWLSMVKITGFLVTFFLYLKWN